MQLLFIDALVGQVAGIEQSQMLFYVTAVAGLVVTAMIAVVSFVTIAPQFSEKWADQLGDRADEEIATDYQEVLGTTGHAPEGEETTVEPEQTDGPGAAETADEESAVATDQPDATDDEAVAFDQSEEESDDERADGDDGESTGTAGEPTAESTAEESTADAAETADEPDETGQRTENDDGTEAESN